MNLCANFIVTFYSAEQTCIFPHLSIKNLISLSSASDFWCKHLNLDITRETQLYLILLSLISGLKLFCFSLELTLCSAGYVDRAEVFYSLTWMCLGGLLLSVWLSSLSPPWYGAVAFEQWNSYWTDHFIVSVLGPCCNPSVIYQHSALGPTAAPSWGTTTTSQCVPADSRVERVSSPQASPSLPARPPL